MKFKLSNYKNAFRRSNQPHFLSYYVISEEDTVTKKKLYNQVKYLPISLIYQQTFQIVLNRNNAACISQFPKQQFFLKKCISLQNCGGFVLGLA